MICKRILVLLKCFLEVIWLSKIEVEEVLTKIKKKEAVIPGIWDPVFKTILMECPNYLSDIIYQVTKIPKEYIEENLVFKNTEYPIDSFDEKKRISDVVVEIKENHIILEMNAHYYEGLMDKNLSYVEKLSSITMKIGAEYPRREKIIEINFDVERNRSFPESEKTIYEFGLYEKEEHFLYSEHITIYHIDLEKIRKKYYNKDKEIDRFEKEMLLLMETDKEVLSELSKGDETMEEAKKKLEDLSNGELFTEYEREQMKEAEERAIKRYELKMAREEGKEEGLEQAHQEKIGMAKKLRNLGLTDQEIMQVTNLSEEEIRD